MMRDWRFATWYWPTDCGCWGVQYDLRSWLFGVFGSRTEFIVHIGPFQFFWSSVL